MCFETQLEAGNCVPMHYSCVPMLKKCEKVEAPIWNVSQNNGGCGFHRDFKWVLN